MGEQAQLGRDHLIGVMRESVLIHVLMKECRGCPAFIHSFIHLLPRLSEHEVFLIVTIVEPPLRPIGSPGCGIFSIPSP